MKLINESAKEMLFGRIKSEKIKLKEYPYFYAKIMYRKGSLLKKEDYERLLKTDSPYEIADYLKKKTYAQAINTLSATVPKNILIEAAMKYNTARECNEFIKYSVNYRGLNILLSALFKNYYLSNVKYFALGKINSMSFDEIKPYLIPFGNMTYESFYSYYTRPTETDFFNSLKIDKKTKKLLIGVFKEKKLVDLQNILDMYYYINLSESFYRISNKQEVLADYLNVIIGSKNIMNILKLKRENVEKEKIVGIIIPNKVSRIQGVLRKLVNAKDLDECFSILSATKWQRKDVDIIKKAVDAKDIELLECLLEKIKITRAKKIFGVRNISAEVVIGYLAQKDIERRNILAIANGKKYGLEEEEIRKHLVI
ncbi:MAG: hypothetical protein DRN66_01035 [Candidatus Nanohalarchaeota archaeon]|nr:MAG: hypothetical protein DRN66_01035 [Candidatus Nanohaloarchaeota archaeon]